MKLVQIIDRIRSNIFWSNSYDKDEPILMEPSPARLKERKPGKDDPVTTFSYWTDSGRFWYFFQDLKMKVAAMNLPDNVVADHLEAAILEYNWAIILQTDKTNGLTSPLDRPINLDHVKREGFDWIMNHAYNRCSLSRHSRDGNNTSELEKSLKIQRSKLKEQIQTMFERGYAVI